tara:strand:+ start:498 stop:737 length:240 start_codon:yes stop_codon:yes gene_type:complete
MTPLEIFMMLSNKYNITPSCYNLDMAEEHYKKEISKFSKSYLQGSSWYVGKSYKKFVNNRLVDRRIFAPFIIAALDKIS